MVSVTPSTFPRFVHSRRAFAHDSDAASPVSIVLPVGSRYGQHVCWVHRSLSTPSPFISSAYERMLPHFVKAACGHTGFWHIDLRSGATISRCPRDQQVGICLSPPLSRPCAHPRTDTAQHAHVDPMTMLSEQPLQPPYRSSTRTSMAICVTHSSNFPCIRAATQHYINKSCGMPAKCVSLHKYQSGEWPTRLSRTVMTNLHSIVLV
jgi:hypothetical protein